MSPLSPEETVVVSGLPRSGTSMVMRMLEAGGMAVLTDHVRTADESNPRGYFEFERVKRLREDKEWLPLARGRAVKIISFLLPELPPETRCRIIFVRRSLAEVLASQRKMLEQRGMPVADPEADARRMARLYEKHLAQIQEWLGGRPAWPVLEVGHRDALENPPGTAERINEFLGGGLDGAAMAAAVDPALHRQRC